MIRICTYNIHGAVGADGARDAERIAHVLSELNSDIVALQEVTDHPVEGVPMPEFLARAAGYRTCIGPTLLRGDHRYGNAVLSRLPLEHVRRIDLSVPAREPRGALDVAVQAGNRTLRLITTHLGLRPGERRQQVRRLIASLGRDAEPAAVTVLTGDINEWFLWGRPVRWLNRHFSRTRAPASFPARFPLLALDRIWVDPASAARSVSVHVSPSARLASDHLPVCASLALS
jgi:endonuclease/exonuclease/phosphatase family metal-dependent hydrolase